jgi:glutathione S-transferase
VPILRHGDLELYETSSIIRYLDEVGTGASLQPAIRAAVPNMERDVARLDGAYAQHAFIAGDAPSLADLLVAPIIQTVSMFPEGKRAVAAAGNLSRAYANIRARPSFESVHAGMPG